MTVQSKSTLKTYFETGDFPTQQEFSDLIDTFAIYSDLQNSTGVAALTTGTAPNFSLILTPAVTAYALYQRFLVQFHSNGAGNDVLNVNGLGNISLKIAGSNTSYGTITANMIAEVYYDGTNFILNKLSQAAGITAIVQDTAPQLGGNLDVQSFQLKSSTGTVGVSADKFIVSASASYFYGPVYGKRASIEVNTSARELLLTDANTRFACSAAAGTQLISIPADVSVNFPADTEIELFRRGAAAVSVTANSGVTLISKTSLKNLSAQYSAAYMKKESSNTWSLVGDLA